MSKTPEQKKKASEAAKRWRDKNLERSRYLVRKYRNKPESKEKALVYRRRYNLEQRIAILKYYSNGDIKCACCGEKTYQFMALDHIDGNGNKHRRDNNLMTPNKLYYWIKQNNFPPIFQVLCHNCNMAKAFNGICPHKNI